MPADVDCARARRLPHSTRVPQPRAHVRARTASHVVHDAALHADDGRYCRGRGREDDRDDRKLSRSRSTSQSPPAPASGHRTARRRTAAGEQRQRGLRVRRLTRLVAGRREPAHEEPREPMVDRRRPVRNSCAPPGAPRRFFPRAERPGQQERHGFEPALGREGLVEKRLRPPRRASARFSSRIEFSGDVQLVRPRRMNAADISSPGKSGCRDRRSRAPARRPVPALSSAAGAPAATSRGSLRAAGCASPSDGSASSSTTRYERRHGLTHWSTSGIMASAGWRGFEHFLDIGALRIVGAQFARRSSENPTTMAMWFVQAVDDTGRGIASGTVTLLC